MKKVISYIKKTYKLSNPKIEEGKLTYDELADIEEVEDIKLSKNIQVYVPDKQKKKKIEDIIVIIKNYLILDIENVEELKVVLKRENINTYGIVVSNKKKIKAHKLKFNS